MTAILDQAQPLPAANPVHGDQSTLEVATRLRAMVSGVGGLVSGSHRLPTALASGTVPVGNGEGTRVRGDPAGSAAAHLSG